MQIKIFILFGTFFAVLSIHLFWISEDVENSVTFLLLFYHIDDCIFSWESAQLRVALLSIGLSVQGRYLIRYYCNTVSWHECVWLFYRTSTKLSVWLEFYITMHQKFKEVDKANLLLLEKVIKPHKIPYRSRISDLWNVQGHQELFVNLTIFLTTSVNKRKESSRSQANLITPE